jgi:hypothetical protein
MTTARFTALQQDAIDKITALLTIEVETGTITTYARNTVMQRLPLRTSPRLLQRSFGSNRCSTVLRVMEIIRTVPSERPLGRFLWRAGAQG